MVNWLLFSALGLIWGSSFLLIKISVADFGALPLASARLGIAAIAFLLFLIVTRKKLSATPKTMLYLALMGITNNAIPFILITWGEQSIDSGLAGVLNATVPLFSVIFAHIVLTDDKIHLGKIFGLITGFVGMVILATRATDPNHQNSVLGQLAILGAAVSYAFSAVFMRRNLRHVDSMVTAGMTVTYGAIATLFFTFITGAILPDVTKIPALILLSVLALGLLNTFIAYILYFKLMANWGASRATMVTYVTPPVSLALGVLFGSEVFDLRLVVAAGLIISGVLVANLWKVRPKTVVVASS